MLCFFCLLGSLHSENFRIRDVFFERFHEGDFCRLSDFFSAKKSKNQHSLFRTDAQKTAGIYMIAFLNRPANKLPPNSTLEIAYDLARDPQRQIHKFPLTENITSSREIWIGLTKAEEQSLALRDFLAWKIQIKNEEGHSLAERQSFAFAERN